MKKKYLHVAVVIFLLAGCTSSREDAMKLVDQAGWKSQTISAGQFDLVVAEPVAPRQGVTMWIYLEGDGAAFITPERPSSDPTPRDPIGLRLALAHPGSGPVAYIARPCQFVTGEHRRSCQKSFWTDARYAPEVTDSTNAVIDQLKKEAGANNLVLVGYSGGGALAVLAASGRKDVVGIITIAGNLDVAYWTMRHELSPLQNSRNPADVVDAMLAVPQVHFVGGKDEVVGPDVVQTYLKHAHTYVPQQMIVVPNYTHTCCWAENWPHLLGQTGVLQYPPFNTSNAAQ